MPRGIPKNGINKGQFKYKNNSREQLLEFINKQNDR